jgi:homocysteine S-methyltransferase
MDPLQPLLARQGVVILDGGLATELERRGADLRDELWSARLLLDDPALIRAVHRDYLEAGADVVVSASYQASPVTFSRRGISPGDALALLGSSVALAREERDRFWTRPGLSNTRLRPLVAASVGPYGAVLADGSEYRGRYAIGESELSDFHRPRLAALIEAGPDLLAVETIPSVAEAAVVVGLLAEWPAMSAWVSFSCRDAGHVSEGQPIEAAVAAVASSPQVVAVGVNCVAPAHVAGLLRRMRRVTSKPLVVYPNSGERWDPVARAWRPGSRPFVPARDAIRWHRAGAALVGGCCRTTPATIAAVRRALLESHR